MCLTIYKRYFERPYRERVGGETLDSSQEVAFM